MNPNKLRDKVERLQQWSFIIFVLSASIAIFSDNVIFETLCLFSGTIFAVTMWLEKQI